MNETKYIISVAKNVPTNIAKKKFMKIKDYLDNFTPSGDWYITSSYLDSELCKLYGCPSDIPELLNEVFGKKYVSISSKIVNDKIKTDGIGFAINSDCNRDTTKKTILMEDHDEIINTIQHKVFNDNSICKIFVVVKDNSFDVISKEINIHHSDIVII